MIDRTLTTPIIYLKVYLSYRVIVKIRACKVLGKDY